jgi:hypothetical protein
MVPSQSIGANGQAQQTIALPMLSMAMAEHAAAGASGPSVQLLAVDVKKASQLMTVGAGHSLASAVRMTAATSAPPAISPVAAHTGAIPPAMPGTVPVTMPVPTVPLPTASTPAVLPKPLQPVTLPAGLQASLPNGIPGGVPAVRPTPLPVPAVVAAKQPDGDKKPLQATQATLQQVHQQYMVRRRPPPPAAHRAQSCHWGAGGSSPLVVVLGRAAWPGRRCWGEPGAALACPVRLNACC